MASPEDAFKIEDAAPNALISPEDTEKSTNSMAIEPPDCKDVDDLELCLKRFDLYFDCVKKTDELKKSLVFRYCMASNSQWFPLVNSISTDEMGYSELKEKLLEMINPSALMKNASIIIELVDQRQLDASMSGLEDYYMRFVRIAAKIDSTMIADEAKVGLFIRGLIDQTAVTAVLENTDTLAEVFVRAKKSCRPIATEKIQFVQPKNIENLRESKQKRQRKNSKFCKLCKKYGHWTNDCFTTKTRELYNKMKKTIENHRKWKNLNEQPNCALDENPKNRNQYQHAGSQIHRINTLVENPIRQPPILNLSKNNVPSSHGIPTPLPTPNPKTSVNAKSAFPSNLTVERINNFTAAAEPHAPSSKEKSINAEKSPNASSRLNRQMSPFDKRMMIRQRIQSFNSSLELRIEKEMREVESIESSLLELDECELNLLQGSWCLHGEVGKVKKLYGDGMRKLFDLWKLCCLPRG